MSNQQGFANETEEAREERARDILGRLRDELGDARIELNWSNPLELLVATILSAQCTDERVNLVTTELFKKYRAPEDYLLAPQEELEEDIRSTGFYRNKAKSLRKMCHALLERHHGHVPDQMDELVKLAGVGRKTANIVLSAAFGKNEGVAVDTHVKRLSGRLGLSANTDPDKIEHDLMALMPREEWMDTTTLLILHGRRVCTARRPDCAACAVAYLCPSREI